eukprot:TRINITY_DN5824_c0_g1_i3.p1 TRINITY_DN5824_c0_g1~~TRINITY_DN5824_c0_g1_i3.p1  ORF type:complete len:237 (-),score=37.88 TRINITY_DN5824_c0_g1_i3:10-690(-)
MFIALPGGVFEFGSTEILTEATDFFGAQTVQAWYAGQTLPASIQKLQCSRSRGRPNQTHVTQNLHPVTPGLLRLVEASKACYGIEWSLGDDGMIIHRAHYNPQWRVEGVRQEGLQGLYTEDSAGWKFSPGEGLVGKVFSEQRPLFIRDLQDMPEDTAADVMHPQSLGFKRLDLAKKYGIHSAMFIALPDGVIELGATHIFEQQDSLLSKKGLRESNLNSRILGVCF